MATSLTTLPAHRAGLPAGDCDVAVPFDAMIWPHISWSDRGFHTFAAVVAAIAVMAGGFCAWHHLWPISVFIVADALAVIVAIAVLRRGRRRFERVQLDGGALLITRGDAAGIAERMRLSLFGLRMQRHEDPDFGCRRLVVVGCGRGVELARDLSPAERESFASAFAAAVRGRGAALVVETIREGLPLDATAAHSQSHNRRNPESWP